jgi:aspartyl-tRNA(Asn)/glutamyl-tRNA(Gln) amidotransferase subunit B
MASALSKYEPVIGLECHVQLKTASKLFSPAPNRFGDGPNENVDLVDAGLPGVLPVPNTKAVAFAVRLGVALGCTIRQENVFARKHYFYPDLPKGYQISQFDRPICEGGAITITTAQGEREVKLTRIHIEEDAGKLVHEDGGPQSYVDLNRAGTPLLEVVSEPDLFSAEEAMAYFRALRQIVMALEICDGNLQEGSMRADANVSVRKPGAPLGERTETKNLNSIRFLGQAIDAEILRQVHELEAGGTIVQQTRLWDADNKQSRVMRDKEDAHDYRYFPDPDLLPVIVSDEAIARVKAELPELPRARVARLIGLGLDEEQARQMVEEKALADYLEQAIAHHDAPKSIANWMLNELKDDVLSGPVTPAALAKLVKLIDDKVLTGKLAKDVLAVMLAGEGDDPEAIVDAKGWRVERDEGKLSALIAQLIDDNPKQAEQYRGGKTKLLGFFVGQVMKATKGQADPAEVNRLLKAALDDGA